MEIRERDADTKVIGQVRDEKVSIRVEAVGRKAGKATGAVQGK